MTVEVLSQFKDLYYNKKDQILGDSSKKLISIAKMRGLTQNLMVKEEFEAFFESSNIQIENP